MPRYAGTFEMKNGLKFEYQFDASYWPGNFHNPPEMGDPTNEKYFIEGEEVDEDKLPKGLIAVCEDMDFEQIEDDDFDDYPDPPDYD